MILFGQMTESHCVKNVKPRKPMQKKIIDWGTFKAAVSGSHRECTSAGNDCIDECCGDLGPPNTCPIWASLEEAGEAPPLVWSLVYSAGGEITVSAQAAYMARKSNAILEEIPQSDDTIRYKAIVEKSPTDSSEEAGMKKECLHVAGYDLGGVLICEKCGLPQREWAKTQTPDEPDDEPKK
jgi:hypothetical protein